MFQLQLCKTVGEVVGPLQPPPDSPFHIPFLIGFHIPFLVGFPPCAPELLLPVFFDQSYFGILHFTLHSAADA